MADYLALAAQLRANREAENKARISAAQQGGAAMSNGGMVGQGGFQSTGGFQPPQNNAQNQQQENPLQQGIDAYDKYNKASQMMSPSAGSSLGATGTAYAGSGLGGTGYGLGGSLVSGGSSGAGAGSGLGSMLGSYGSSGGAAAAGSGSFGTLGSTTQGGLGAMLGSSGGGAAGGSTAGGASGAAGGGVAGAGGMLAGLAALSYLGDKEMNENKGSFINADKLNNSGTIGGSGIGIRFGDFANGFNPGTWVSDPKKAGKALVNAFTLGFLDKFM